MKTIKARIGETLLLLQKIEALLRASLYGVGNTKDTKLAKLLDRDHQTMGMLINGMKRQVELPEEFATTLDHLLRDRNILVHELFLQNWFDLQSESGLKQTNLFLDQIIANASVVVRIVIAFVLSIEENNSTINSLSEKKRKIYDHIINRIKVTSEPDLGDKTPDEYFDAFSDQVREKFVKKIKPKN